MRKFVEEFHATGKPLHVLVNNAGVFYEMKDKNPKISEDGFEMTMASNHLGRQ